MSGADHVRLSQAIRMSLIGSIAAISARPLCFRFLEPNGHDRIVTTRGDREWLAPQRRAERKRGGSTLTATSCVPRFAQRAKPARPARGATMREARSGRKNHVREKSNFACPVKLIWVVQSLAQKYFCFVFS